MVPMLYWESMADSSAIYFNEAKSDVHWILGTKVPFCVLICIIKAFEWDIFGFQSMCFCPSFRYMMIFFKLVNGQDLLQMANNWKIDMYINPCAVLKTLYLI